MDNAVVDEFDEACADLLEVVYGIRFGNDLSFLEGRSQVPSITILLSYVVVVGGLQDIHEANNILAVELS